jgi:antitoxin MazE
MRRFYPPGKMMKNTIRKIGNSHGVIIPKPLLAELGAKANDQIDITIVNRRIVISRVGQRPRAGWAEASKRLAAMHDREPDGCP